MKAGIISYITIRQKKRMDYHSFSQLSQDAVPATLTPSKARWATAARLLPSTAKSEA